MSTSGSMFKKQTPFQLVPVVGKTNRTSHFQNMTKTKKKAAPGVARPKESPVSKLQTVNEKTQKTTRNEDNNTDRHPTLSEIWPSSEPSSPSDTPTSDRNELKLSTVKSSHPGTQQGPLLARYVERFRHGQPQSREKRQQITSTNEEKQLPFWWASSSSFPPSLTPEKTNKEHSLRHPNRSPSPCRGFSSILSDISQCELADSEILQLQEKATKLLEKGEFCLDEESIPVSSDGLGCSDFSSPISADEPVRRPVIPSLLTCNTNAMNLPQAPSFISTLVPPTRPEDDILFQWRLRRKMEKAREWTQSQHLSSLQGWQGPTQSQSHAVPSEHPLMPEPPHRIYLSDLSPGIHSQMTAPHLTSTDHHPSSTIVNSHPTAVASHSLASPSHALAPVPSHMHLICDILPCPNKSSHSHVEENISERLDKSTTQPQTTQNLEIKHMQKTYLSESGEKDVSLPPAKSNEYVQLKSPEKNERNTPIDPKGQKKASGVNSRQRVSKKPSTEQHKQRHRYPDSKMMSTADDAPPPSPIHSALGQVSPM